MSVRREPYAAFFDASGKPKQPGGVLFVSGCVSTEAKWLRFDEHWKALMRKWGIKKLFHTTEYAAGRGSDYARFRNNDAERIAFEAEAIPLIKTNTNKRFHSASRLTISTRLTASIPLPPALIGHTP